MTHPGYEYNVFLNCPFDDKYTHLFRAMVFAVHDCGFVARAALEADDSSQVRITKLMQIMRESRYGIHDISRTEVDRGTRYPRFNMPLELGIFLGAKEFGSGEQRRKACLVLDREQYRYQAICSDIAGQDIRAHNDEPTGIIKAVRNFLASQRPEKLLPGASRMAERFELFREQLPTATRRNHLRLSELKFHELRSLVLTFLQSNPSW